MLPSSVSCAVGMAKLKCIPSGGGDIDGGHDHGDDIGGGVDRDGNDDGRYGGRDRRRRNDEDDGGHRAMDNGGDCAMAMLSCVRSFLAPTGASVRAIDVQDEARGDIRGDGVVVVGGGSIPPTRRRRRRVRTMTTTSSLTRLVANEVGSAMGGALIARLVEGCLSILSSSRLSSNGRRGGGGIATTTRSCTSRH